MQLIAAPRQLHQLVAQIMVIVRRAVDGFRDALAVVIVGIRPRPPRRLIVLAHITRDSHAGIISFLIPCGPIMVMLLETG